ncbi:hypothetical protein M9H77_07156 [Catharanthus roseus]|uniref:Uncharacterized protein n=1 Tax=Catharanthus roseus TaxID=4058 RepID=A0ACC0BU92_CATRO|nr:hypothetical protein M9H77_07156 [Catharanthus roseus]
MAQGRKRALGDDASPLTASSITATEDAGLMWNDPQGQISSKKALVNILPKIGGNFSDWAKGLPTIYQATKISSVHVICNSYLVIGVSLFCVTHSAVIVAKFIGKFYQRKLFIRNILKFWPSTPVGKAVDKCFYRRQSVGTSCYQ